MNAEDVHIDVPLSNMVIGFEPKNIIVDQIFPSVPVTKQSDKYYIWDKGNFFRVPTNTLRAPKTKGKEVIYTVSSDSFFCDNFALRHEESFEAMANADTILAGREKKVRSLKALLMLDREIRVANLVGSTSNVGSSTTLTGTNQWNDYTNSDPIDDIEVAKEAIRSTTGLDANLMIISQPVYRKLLHHPDLVDRLKYVQKGILTVSNLAEIFELDRILIGKTIKNTGEEGHDDAFSDVWAKDAILMHTTNAPDADGQDPSAGYTFDWTSPMLGGLPMAAEIWNNPDGGNFENRRVQYYGTEKITAAELIYTIKAAVA